jgi:hypothetical protein
MYEFYFLEFLKNDKFWKLTKIKNITKFDNLFDIKKDISEKFILRKVKILKNYIHIMLDIISNIQL